MKSLHHRFAYTILVVASTFVVGLLATPAASQPSASRSEVPSGITLVGAHDGIPDPHGEFQIVVRDAASNPIPFTTVRIDFSQCLDVWPSSVQPYAGVNMDCATRIVSTTTDGNGRARMILLGSVLYRSPASGYGCAEVHADPGNVVIGHMNAACADQDGIDGVDGRDVDRVFCDNNSGMERGRSDFDATGTMSPSDYLADATIAQGGGSAESGARCDGLANATPTVVDNSPVLVLSWDECRSTGGADFKNKDCTLNIGNFGSIVGSVVAGPGLTSVIGFKAVVDIVGEPGSTLPPWWQFQSGGCRAASHSLGLRAPFDASCSPALSDGGSLYNSVTYPFGAPNVERIEISGSGSTAGALEPGTEYALFELNIDMKRTVSQLLQPPPCAGCSDHVLIKLHSLELVQGADASCGTPVEGQSLADGYHNVLADRPDATSHVFAQGTITAVDDQAHVRFALWHGGANPVHGALEIGFALPGEARARLELLDVGGRVVTSRDLGSLGPGSHRTRLELPRGTGAGVYWVKLSQAGKTRTLKCVLMR